MAEEYWKKVWSQSPCNTCKKRWPNENNPDSKIGDGCDGLACEYRPDLTNEHEPKEESK